jgi:hypothetical protein
MNLEIFMVEGQDRLSALSTLKKVAQRMPTGFFSRIHFCTPFEKPGELNLSDCAVSCHHAPIENIRTCDRYVLRTIPFLCQADHYMIVHKDGYPIHPEKWTDEFLQYDYIGAPWRWTDGRNNVGCGGFCIRSRRLGQWIAAQQFEHDMNEDEIICHRFYDQAVAAGFTFAPVSLAARFSLENQLDDLPRTLDDVFGFHGKFHLSTINSTTTQP